MSRFISPLFIAAAAADVPSMPTEYSTVMKLRLPYIGLEMPMRILTSATAQKNEYYDGLQVDTSNANGTHKYTFNNAKRVCMFSPPSTGPMLGSSEWKAQVFLPDLSKYTSAGDELVGGIMCQKYTLYAKHGTTGTMDDHVSFYWDPVLEKPVRWHFHSRPEPFGSHTDEYILDYLSFQRGAPNELEFLLPSLCSKQAIVADIAPMQVSSFLTSTRTMHSASSNEQTDIIFEAFLKQHAKTYSAEEHEVRRGIFEKNVQLVKDLNRRHAGVTTFKGNQFLDMTKEEVLRFRGGKRRGGSRAQRRTAEHKKLVSAHASAPGAATPVFFDWRTAQPGVVGAVKDQAMCGSCWAYGALGPVESINAIQSGGRYIELPEQSIVDCAWTNGTGDSGGNFGCDGGDSDIGILEFVKKYGGVIPTAQAYGSYLSMNGYCKDMRLMDVGARVTGWVDIQPRSQQDFMDAVATKGPVSVGIMVPDEMLYYDSGVLNVESCRHNESQIDHAVVVTGYGTDANGIDYYTIRNSWSTYWGEQGYINVARGDLDCATSSEAGYPTVALSKANVIV